MTEREQELERNKRWTSFRADSLADDLFVEDVDELLIVVDGVGYTVSTVIDYWSPDEAGVSFIADEAKLRRLERTDLEKLGLQRDCFHLLLVERERTGMQTGDSEEDDENEGFFADVLTFHIMRCLNEPHNYKNGVMRVSPELVEVIYQAINKPVEELREIEMRRFLQRM